MSFCHTKRDIFKSCDHIRCHFVILKGDFSDAIAVLEGISLSYSRGLVMCHTVIVTHVSHSLDIITVLKGCIKEACIGLNDTFWVWTQLSRETKSGFPLFSRYQIPGFLRVFGPKIQVFSRFFVPNSRHFHTNFSYKNIKMC